MELIGVESILDALKNKARELIVIDEIGKMELFLSRFQDAVIKALDSSKKVLGTIQLKSNFVERIKARKDVEIVSVNTNNRDYMRERILIAISKR